MTQADEGVEVYVYEQEDDREYGSWMEIKNIMIQQVPCSKF
jgi:hypothetical protein